MKNGQPLPKLSAVQRIAVLTCMQRMAQAKQEMDEVMREVGLDPKKVYEVRSDGVVKERV